MGSDLIVQLPSMQLAIAVALEDYIKRRNKDATAMYERDEILKVLSDIHSNDVGYTMPRRLLDEVGP